MNERVGQRYEKLEEVRRRIVATIDGIDSERLNRAPAQGGWSAAQVIGHIVLAESRTLEYLTKKLSDPSRLHRAGLKERFNGWLVVVVMGLPIRVRAPEIVADVPERADPAELCSRWERVRADLRALLDTIPDSLLGTCLFRHPVAGPMTVEAALDFMTAHASRHAKQLDRALAKAGEGR
jgi:hypothetical protein